MHRIAGWWDGFELWVAGLPFLPQFAVVLIGMVPISLLIAYLLDRFLREALRLLGRDHTEDPERTPTAGTGDRAAADATPEPVADAAPESDPESVEYGPQPLEYGPQPLEYGPQPLSRTPGARQKETV